MIKKVESSFGGVKGGKNTHIGSILGFKPLFCQSALTTLNKLAEKVYLGVLQHPTKFQAEILTGKVLYLNKIKKSTRRTNYFLGLFLAITPKPRRLAAYPRPPKLQNSL